VLAAVLASISGWLFAHFQRTVNPSPFGIKRASSTCSWRCSAASAHVWGAFTGAGVVKLLEDQLQVLLPKLIGTSGNYESDRVRRHDVLVLKYAPDGLWTFIDRAGCRGRAAASTGTAPRLPARAKPAAGEVVLEVQAMRKQFGGLVAVNDISFEIRAGEIVGLIGPNGAGKSTTFNLVTGVLALTGGAGALPGRAIGGLGSRRSRARHVAHLPAREDDARHDGAGERRAGRLPARHARAPSRAMLRLDRAEERALFAEAERQLRASAWPTACTSWPATWRWARSA
jgi:branched-chain amino acid transport system permease protein